MLFPRWTGLDSDHSILLGKESLVSYINTYNGRKACTVSVYAFREFKNSKPVIQSAIIDCLYSIGAPDTQLENLKWLDLASVKYVSRFDGENIDIILPLKEIADTLYDTAMMGRKKTNIRFRVNPTDLFLWNNTWNPKTRRFVIETVSTDTVPLLSEISKIQQKRPRPVLTKFVDEL